MFGNIFPMATGKEAQNCLARGEISLFKTNENVTRFGVNTGEKQNNQPKVGMIRKYGENLGLMSLVFIVSISKCESF